MRNRREKPRQAEIDCASPSCGSGLAFQHCSIQRMIAVGSPKISGTNLGAICKSCRSSLRSHFGSSHFGVFSSFRRSRPSARPSMTPSLPPIRDRAPSMPPIRDRAYRWKEGECNYRLSSHCEGILSPFVCKRCWKQAAPELQEDLKNAYPPSKFCLSFGCFQGPGGGRCGNFCQRHVLPRPLFQPTGCGQKARSRSRSPPPRASRSDAHSASLSCADYELVKCVLQLANATQLEGIINACAQQLRESVDDSWGP